MVGKKVLYSIICLAFIMVLSGCIKNLPVTKQPSPPKEATAITIKIPIGSNTVYVNDEEINLSSPPAYIDEGSQVTMVPLRFISDIIGAKVEWVPNTKEIIITQNETVIRMIVKSRKATVNGKEFDLSCEPQIREERAFVPLKFITQNFGFTTDWVPETKTIILYKGS